MGVLPGEGAKIPVVGAKEQRDDFLPRGLELALARVHLGARVY